MNDILEVLQTRNEQVIALTDEVRQELEEAEDMGDSNPILYAESAPCRYQSVTYWFTEEDGVIIQQDMDIVEDITVKYMSGDEIIELTEGPLYDWAIDQYESN
jgi:hypothetical protein